ncbi:MAG: aldo/keto reductase [Thermoguttaceae bacterium]|nr:aldo/keto reductase [Thermoguttaceae bacterium]
MKRRLFIQTAAAGVAAASATITSAENAEADLSPVGLVNLTPQIKTSRVGFGTGVHAGMRQSNMHRMGNGIGVENMRYAYDCGIRFFDMADSYGTHQFVAEALKGKPRDSYTLSTKIWCYPGGGIPEKERLPADQLIERFLKELNTDYIDLINIHCLMSPDWVERFEYQFEPLEKLKKRGLIRAHGVSCHALNAAEIAAKHPWVDSMHLRLNTERQRMDGDWDQNVAVAKTAKENGKGVIIMKVLGEGTINTPEGRKRSTIAVTRMPYKDVMIVGFEAKQHIDEFLENVAEGLKLEAKE